MGSFVLILLLVAVVQQSIIQVSGRNWSDRKVFRLSTVPPSSDTDESRPIWGQYRPGNQDKPSNTPDRPNNTPDKPNDTPDELPSWGQFRPRGNPDTPNRNPDIPNSNSAGRTSRPPNGENGSNSKSDTCVLSSSPPALDSLCCGVDAITNRRIVGGNVTRVEHHPWVVQIEYRDNNGALKRYCGGFLISGRYVMSAAHCFRGIGQLTPVNVILGEYDAEHEGQDCITTRSGDISCTDGAITVPIKDYKVHAQYTLEVDSRNIVTKNINDVAIVMLNRIVEFTKFIRPLCLPTSDIAVSPPAGLRFITVGWGATRAWKESSWGREFVRTKNDDKIKREVEVPFVNAVECRERYSFIADTHICAGGEVGKDSCKGDSGGPLILEVEDVYVAVGIVSTGPTLCGEGGRPAIYSNVYKYLTWIHEQINLFNKKHNVS